MGTLRSSVDHSGLMVGKVTLGDPVRDIAHDGNQRGEYLWDDSRLPNGTIAADGTITIDEEGVL